MAENQLDESSDRIAGAALLALMVISSVMLLALVTKTPPHPPLTTPYFALGPFMAASLATGGTALYLCCTSHPFWRYAAILFAITVLPSFGPQKFLVPEFPEIWPAVLIGQISLLTLAIRLTSAFQTQKRTASRIGEGSSQ